MTLCDIEIGQTCLVDDIGAEGAQRRRMLDMGITRGTEISVIGKAPLGDPMRLELRGYSLALRAEDAQCILVENSV